MSRKSLSKKETAIWYLCNSCNCNVFSKDRESHSCPSDESLQTNCTFIRDKKLISKQLTEKVITDELRGINANKLDSLIFLHESVFSLCDLILGDNVLISSSALANNAAIVRNAWPISGSSAGLVSVTEEGLLQNEK